MSSSLSYIFRDPIFKSGHSQVLGRPEFGEGALFNPAYVLIAELCFQWSFRLFLHRIKWSRNWLTWEIHLVNARCTITTTKEMTCLPVLFIFSNTIIKRIFFFFFLVFFEFSRHHYLMVFHSRSFLLSLQRWYELLSLGWNFRRNRTTKIFLGWVSLSLAPELALSSATPSCPFQCTSVSFVSLVCLIELTDGRSSVHRG